jgi:hypothetical protein
MKVGIGLPTTIPGVQPDQVLDRLIYPNYEPLVALGAVAAVTDRIGLMTAVLLVPYRQNAAVVAKQAATVHQLSRGRLTLGVGMGSRDDDHTAFGLPTKGRGKRLNEMLDQVTRLWAGEEVGYAGGVGPDVSGNPPQLIVGGSADAASRRAARYGDGWRMPRKLALQYFALGDDPEGDARASIGHYYAFAEEYAEQIVAATAKGEHEIRERVRQFQEAGADELILFHASPDPEQVDMLASAVL